jgi:AI-2 transport protein TqsA
MMDEDPAPAPTRQRPSAPPLLAGLQVTVAVILIGWALHATASVSALLAAAFFAAVMLAPLDASVCARAGGRRWVGHLASLVVMVVVLLAFAAGLLFAAQRIASDFPTLGRSEVAEGSNAGEAVGDEDGATGGGAGEVLDGLGLTVSDLFARLANAAGDLALTGLQYGTTALAGIVLTIFLALMMLVDAPSWRRRVARVAGERRRDEALETMAVMGRMVRRFVLVRAAMGLVTALLYMGWLWLFGVDLILVWGILTFLLGFVPNLGSVLSGLLPTIYAVLTKDPGTALAVGAGLLAVEQVIGNYVDPRVQGRQVSISPAVILCALLIFAWLWGVPGALLSTPVLIAAVVVFARIDALRPMALLLSDCDDYDGLDEMVRG